MLNAVLLDLDNTLILFDEAEFYRGYFERIEGFFADFMPADRFRERLISATRAMIKNNGQISNAEYFKQAFASGYPDRQEELWHRFLNFYASDYDRLEARVSLPEGLQATIKSLVRKGLKLVLASNPIFPLNVQLKRLAWGGLASVRFDLVTHIENMSFCKPRIEYYQEISRKIAEPAAACLMVGNDPVNDMVAGLAGMKTYLTDDSKGAGRVSIETDELLAKLCLGPVPKADFTGPLAQVPEVVARLQRNAAFSRLDSKRSF